MTAVTLDRRTISYTRATVAYTDGLRTAYPAVAPAEPDSSNSWVELPRADCQRLTVRAGGVDDAQLIERFDELGQAEPGEPAIATTPWTDLENKYVRVTLPIDAEDGGTVVWYGYVMQGARNRVAADAQQDDGNGGEETITQLLGVQQWRVVGLEWFLGRQQIDSSVVADRSPGAAVGATRRLLRALDFNGGDPTQTVDQNRPRGNKAQTLLAFTSPEAVTDLPRGLVKADADFTKQTTLLNVTAIATVTPKDYGSSAPADPTSLQLTAGQMEGLAGDRIRTLADPADISPGPPGWNVDPQASTEWHAAAMLDYLLEHHAPTDVNDTAAPIPFRLASGRDVLLGLKPSVPTAGRDVLSLINAIAAPNRGVIWSCQTVTPDEDAGLTVPEVRLAAHSLAVEAIPLPGGTNFPANPDPIELNADDDVWLEASFVSTDRSGRYDKIIARGARVTSTFTLSIADGTLVPDWDDDDEAGYLAGASNDPDYPGTEDEQKRANDARRSELAFARVFSAFRLAPDFDGEAADGDAASVRTNIFPLLNVAGAEIGAYNPYLPGLRPLRRTRLPMAADRGITDEFQAPFAVILDADDNWAFTHALTDAASPSDERLASYRLTRAEGGIAFRLNSSKGLAHTLAGTAYDEATPAPSRLPAELDYRDLRITLSVEGDTYAEGEAGATPAVGQAVQTLVIDAGPTFRLDFVNSKTVLGVTRGELDKQPFGERLRDDRETLEAIASMAYAWYRRPTQSIRVLLNRPYSGLALGQMISEIGRPGQTDTIGTVVSSISYGLPDQTTAIETTGVASGGLGVIEGGVKK